MVHNPSVQNSVVNNKNDLLQAIQKKNFETEQDPKLILEKLKSALKVKLVKKASLESFPAPEPLHRHSSVMVPLPAND